jgi:pilus assembly protein Flp/PilA
MLPLQRDQVISQICSIKSDQNRFFAKMDRLILPSKTASVTNAWRNTSVEPLQIMGEPNMSKIMQFLRDDSGATAIEYGLIAAGIAVAIIAVVQGLGTKLTETFKSVSDNLGAATP